MLSSRFDSTKSSVVYANYTSSNIWLVKPFILAQCSFSSICIQFPSKSSESWVCSNMNYIFRRATIWLTFCEVTVFLYGHSWRGNDRDDYPYPWVRAFWLDTGVKEVPAHFLLAHRNQMKFTRILFTVGWNTWKKVRSHFSFLSGISHTMLSCSGTAMDTTARWLEITNNDVE